MKFSPTRLIISLIVVIGLQILLSRVLLLLGLSGILYYVLYSLGVGFIFGLINYGSNLAKAFKDPYFYRYVCIVFLVILGLNLLMLYF